MVERVLDGFVQLGARQRLLLVEPALDQGDVGSRLGLPQLGEPVKALLTLELLDLALRDEQLVDELDDLRGLGEVTLALDEAPARMRPAVGELQREAERRPGGGSGLVGGVSVCHQRAGESLEKPLGDRRATGRVEAVPDRVWSDDAPDVPAAGLVALHHAPERLVHREICVLGDDVFAQGLVGGLEMTRHRPKLVEERLGRDLQSQPPEQLALALQRHRRVVLVDGREGGEPHRVPAARDELRRTRSGLDALAALTGVLLALVATEDGLARLHVDLFVRLELAGNRDELSAARRARRVVELVFDVDRVQARLRRRSVAGLVLLGAVRLGARRGSAAFRALAEEHLGLLLPLALQLGDLGLQRRRLGRIGGAAQALAQLRQPLQQRLVLQVERDGAGSELLDVCLVFDVCHRTAFNHAWLKTTSVKSRILVATAGLWPPRRSPR